MSREKECGTQSFKQTQAKIISMAGPLRVQFCDSLKCPLFIPRPCGAEDRMRDLHTPHKYSVTVESRLSHTLKHPGLFQHLSAA